MDAVLTYRGRAVHAEDVTFIRALRASPDGVSRRRLSLALCAAWNWVQPNGTPRDAVCRGLLLALERAGHLHLPAPRWVARRPPQRHVPSLPPTVDRTVLSTTLADLGPVALRQVRRTPDEALFDGLVQAHHYLGYVQPVGEHLKFIAYAGERPVACLAFSSAPRHLGPRDRFLGWSPETRRRNIRFIAYNSRYLILPWVQVPNLASHLLGRMARRLPACWQEVYGHPVHFLETFVDPTRYRGTCYRAANWVWLGRTTGRGKADLTHRPNRSIKDVWGYPLIKDFREQMTRMP